MRKMSKEKIKEKIDELEKQINNTYDNGIYGCLVYKHIKCGKEGCRCLEGHLHGPYPHIQYYQNNILRTKYIRKKLGKSYFVKLEENKTYRNTIQELIKLYRQYYK